MRSGSTVTVSQTTLMYAITSISRFIEDTMIALVTPEGPNTVKRKENQLQAILQSFANKRIDGILDAVEFESRLLWKFEEATSSRLHVRNMTERMLDYQCFDASVATNVKKDTEKTVAVEWEPEERRRKVNEAA